IAFLLASKRWKLDGHGVDSRGGETNGKWDCDQPVFYSQRGQTTRQFFNETPQSAELAPFDSEVRLLLRFAKSAAPSRPVVVVPFEVGGAAQGTAGSDDDEDDQHSEKPDQDEAHAAHHPPRDVKHVQLLIEVHRDYGAQIPG